MDLLVQKFDYQAYPQKHFESRFTRFYEGFWLLERFGFDTRKVQFSSLILTNQMKRDEALEKLKQKPLDEITIKNDKEFICSKLNISISELENYFSMKKTHYSDYKNQLFLYQIGSKIMRLFGYEKGGKR